VKQTASPFACFYVFAYSRARRAVPSDVTATVRCRDSPADAAAGALGAMEVVLSAGAHAAPGTYTVDVTFDGTSVVGSPLMLIVSLGLGHAGKRQRGAHG